MTPQERAELLAAAEFYAFDNIRRALVYAGYGSFPWATREELESIFLAVRDEPMRAGL